MWFQQKMINIYNESNLHKTLKLFYSDKFNGKTEVPYKKWICDIITESNSIIEIQTSNLQALKEKALSAINDKINFTIIHPIVTEKIIETYLEDGTLISKRKSPKSESLFSKLKSLTGIYDILLNKYITIIFVKIRSTEQRIQTKEKIQLKNKSRHFKKNWYKVGKKLTEISSEQIFYGKKSYLNLLQSTEKKFDAFSSKELKNELIKNGFSKSDVNQTNLILWLLNKMNLISIKEKKGRLIYYKLEQ